MIRSIVAYIPCAHTRAREQQVDVGLRGNSTIRHAAFVATAAINRCCLCDFLNISNIAQEAFRRSFISMTLLFGKAYAALVTATCSIVFQNRRWIFKFITVIRRYEMI